MTDADRVARRTVEGELIEWLDVPPRAAQLGLEPHPEGGWYRRTWTSPATVATPGGPRPAATLIHFLLPAGEASIWHRVVSDEVWLWHGPSTLVLEFGGSGASPQTERAITLGGDVDADQATQATVAAGTWQRTLPGSGDVLVSCLVSPGFSFDDFSLPPTPSATA